jgi:hypothetical protein
VVSQRPDRVPFDLAAELHLKFDAVAVAYRRCAPPAWPRTGSFYVATGTADQDRLLGRGAANSCSVLPADFACRGISFRLDR